MHAYCIFLDLSWQNKLPRCQSFDCNPKDENTKSCGQVTQKYTIPAALGNVYNIYIYNMIAYN